MSEEMKVEFSSLRQYFILATNILMINALYVPNIIENKRNAAILDKAIYLKDQPQANRVVQHEGELIFTDNKNFPAKNKN